MQRDRSGHRLTAGPAAAASYNRGIERVLALRRDAARDLGAAVADDPTFALGHAALGLLGHELALPVDVGARLRDAARHAGRATDRERSHVAAVAAHVAGDQRAVVDHLETWPGDALLLSVAVPTIAFTGVTEVPAEAWAIVERAAPAYGSDWWFSGLLAFVRQEQGRFDEAMDLACRSLDEAPGAGHSAHARAHAHYETGDHVGGLAWMDDWLGAEGWAAESVSHFSWHAALHELSLGDLDAVRRRYDEQLRPEDAAGCRALVDTGSLLFRWALTPDAGAVPGLDDVVAAAGRDRLESPASPFVAMHSAAVLLGSGDDDGLRALGHHARGHAHPTMREVVAPLADAFRLLHAGHAGPAADDLGRLAAHTWRLGGSDAQREVVEEARIAALLQAGRWDDARVLLDARLDRRRSPRDARWREAAVRRG